MRRDRCQDGAVTPDGRILVIRAKRYVMGNTVNSPDLQKFGGTCYTVHRAQVTAVVTTSRFTKQAREYAAATWAATMVRHPLPAGPVPTAGAGIARKAFTADTAICP